MKDHILDCVEDRKASMIISVTYTTKATVKLKNDKKGH